MEQKSSLDPNQKLKLVCLLIGIDLKLIKTFIKVAAIVVTYATKMIANKKMANSG